MRLLHTSDLHLGIKLLDVDLLDDQKYILNEILGVAKKEKVDALLISGDIYDVSVPRVEAVELLNEFITKANEDGLQIFAISGNHDQAERLSFGNKVMGKAGIHISGQYKKDGGKFTLSDKYGKINFFLLPYIKPINVRTEFQIEDSISYNEAAAKAVENFSIDKSERNILLAHQFVTGGVTCESETIQVGNTDQVDADIFDGFDYVALGHLHTPQIVANNEKIRYSGSPLKLSFSEAKKDKVCCLIEAKEKGNLTIKEIPLRPLRDLSILKGSYKELVDSAELKEKYSEHYLRVELTDETDIPYVKEKLKTIYKNTIDVSYQRQSQKMKGLNSQIKEIKELSDLDLIKMFFKEQTAKDLSKRQEKYLIQALDKMEGEK